MATRPPKVLLMRSSASVGAGATAVMTACSRPCCAPSKAVRELLDDWLSTRQTRDADDIGSGDEGLSPEAEDDGVADLRLRRAACVNHAVVVNGCRGGKLDVSQRRGGGRRLARDDRPDLIVGKDRVDVEAATEAERFVAYEMRNFGQTDDRGPFRQVLDGVQRRRSGERRSRFDLRRASLRQRSQ